ncbi:Uncharacterised protein at_DN0763, partial [Pycnogonum litorale]
MKEITRQFTAVTSEQLKRMIKDVLSKEPSTSKAGTDSTALPLGNLPRLQTTIDDGKLKVGMKRKRESKCYSFITSMINGHTSLRVRLFLIVGEHGCQTAMADQQLRNPATADLDISDGALTKKHIQSYTNLAYIYDLSAIPKFT